MKTARLAAIGIIGLALLSLFSITAYGAGPVIALYRVGAGGQQGLTFVKQYLEAKGYQVSLYQGETTIEKHVEKASLINRSAAGLFLAIEMTIGEKFHVMVARTEAKKGEGRFLTIAEVPERFAGESRALSDAIGASFGVKVKQMPLFPLLGISMPGVFIRMDGAETEMPDFAKGLHRGLEKYFRKG
jgi:hypothetical protein